MTRTRRSLIRDTLLAILQVFSIVAFAQAQPASPTPSGMPPSELAPEKGAAPPLTQQQRFDQVRQACTDAAKAHGLKDYEFDRSVRSCFLRSPYVIAREMECQQEGIKRGLAGRDFRPFIRRCMSD
jgi:hypothetical protein